MCQGIFYYVPNMVLNKYSNKLRTLLEIEKIPSGRLIMTLGI